MVLTLRQLGELVADYRGKEGISQRELGEKIEPRLSRTVVALLEQGRRLPSEENLSRICEYLKIPEQQWRGFVTSDNTIILRFEAALSELVGYTVDVSHLDETGQSVARQAVIKVFKSKHSEMQCFDTFNSLLIHYNVQPQMSQAFFDTYLTAGAFESSKAFEDAVHQYQTRAIRVFNSFQSAYQMLNGSDSLKQLENSLEKKKEATYRARTDWSDIEIIENSKLPHLAYVAAAKAQQQRSEREELAAFLRTLADDITKGDLTALQRQSKMNLSRMETLARKFESKLQPGIFSLIFQPEPDELLHEADAISPKNDKDWDEVKKTQAQALRNLARYLSADYLDVYVATSMRLDPDFVSVNDFVSTLFEHDDLRGLNLRYFNPTQSWIEDRVAKGLVEALMLRRARFTIYMAQKSDSFGKDSEASVALGQGKPVIVYVPKLSVSEIKTDSEELMRLSEKELAGLLAEESGEKAPEGPLNRRSLLIRLLELRLKKASVECLGQVAYDAWADFGLSVEIDKVDPARHDTYKKWLAEIERNKRAVPMPEELRDDFVKILVYLVDLFESRAETFREKHPLALQVVLSSGVLNGMIVARSIASCARVLKDLITNDLKVTLEIDDNSYRLVENSTQSTIRVISRHALIASAFATHYAQSVAGDRIQVVD